MLQPIWDEAADRLAATLPDAKVVFAKVISRLAKNHVFFVRGDGEVFFSDFVEF